MTSRKEKIIRNLYYLFGIASSMQDTKEKTAKEMAQLLSEIKLFIEEEK